MSTPWRPDIEAISVDEALTLVVGWKERKHVEGRLVRTAPSVSDALRDTCRDTRDELAASRAISYGPDAHIESGEYMAIPTHIIEGESLHVLDLLRRPSALDTLDPRDVPTKLWFYAAVVGDDPGDRIAFVRKTDPHIEAKPGWVIGTLGETLTRTRQPVFVLESRFDVLVLDEGLIVLNATPFEILFRGAPELAERIPVWARAITDHLPLSVDSAERLIEAAKRNSFFARRMRSIYEQGHLAGVTIGQLQSEARAQGLDPKALFNGGKLMIDDDTDIDTLLRLLNEDLFTGGLSTTKYAADRKRTR